MERDKVLLVKNLFRTDHLDTVDEAQTLIDACSGIYSITLDFSGVNNIGEDFARAIFVTWRKNNPRVILNVVRACESVENVINQVVKI